MSLPLLMLIPWNPPAPPPPPSNPWAAPPAPNVWDLAGVMVGDEIAKVIDDAFGARLSLTELLDLLYGFQHDRLNEVQRVQVIEMGIYFARNTLGWRLAPDNLQHWLIAGGLPKPEVIMDHTLLMNQEPVIDTLVDKHYDAIVDAIKKRLWEPDTRFPAKGATIPGPQGTPITVDPAESPLPAGGEETLYLDASTHTTDSHLTDLFNAVNAVRLVSQVHVKSQVLETGGWQVTIDDWQVWFYDTYDWNKGDQSVRIPIELFDNLPLLAPFRSTIEDTLKQNAFDPSVMQEITVTDAQMAKIEGRTIAMPDGTTRQPKAYPIYSDGSWSFKASEFGKETVLQIPPPPQ